MIDTRTAALVEGVLAGDRLSLSRAISRVENERTARPLLSALFAHTGGAHIIGVTGAPGSGKSTLVTALVQSLRETSKRAGGGVGSQVAVLAVDPTSPFTGGAILGDRVRMRALSGDAGVFIRSMATRGTLGGLSRTAGDVVNVLDAAGFHYIIVETVGVGQAEVEIARTAHTTLLVDAPGMGDGVQAIKAGVIEIADLIVVNKADRPGADHTVRALEMALEIEGDARTVSHHGQLFRVERAESGEATGESDRASAERWRVSVHKSVATSGEGVDVVHARIDEHRAWLRASGEWATRERLRAATLLENLLRAEFERRIIDAMPRDEIDALVNRIQARETDPYSAAIKLSRSE